MGRMPAEIFWGAICEQCHDINTIQKLDRLIRKVSAAAQSKEVLIEINYLDKPLSPHCRVNRATDD